MVYKWSILWSINLVLNLTFECFSEKTNHTFILHFIATHGFVTHVTSAIIIFIPPSYNNLYLFVLILSMGVSVTAATST